MLKSSDHFENQNHAPNLEEIAEILSLGVSLWLKKKAQSDTPDVHPVEIVNADPLKNSITEFLMLHKQASIGEIMVSVDKPRSTIRRRLDDLQKEGKISRIGKGRGATYICCKSNEN